jgi:glycosyltransferase involved in cell wall biosynthesis
MPAHFVGRPVKRSSTAPLQKRLLFFGLVRKYKGLDVLLQALVKVPDIKLTIAGEMWGKQRLALETSIAELKLGQRVMLRAGYVADDDAGAVFASADALVLPYRAGTGSWNAELGFYHGLPVIASRVGSFTQKIRDGVDGLLCKPGDVESLAAAISHFYETGVAAQLRAGIPKVSTDNDWQAYVDTLTHF